MSRDSSPTYIHFHQSRLADFFEEFNRPHSSLTSFTSSSSSAAAANGAHSGANISPGGPSGGQTIPSFLPIEDIYLPPHYQPVNPEDEDDVVPDQHAAFGITRAMDARREIVWRDLGLEELMRGVRLGVGSEGQRRTRVPASRKAERARLGRRVTCLR
ncbi:hypothetical protein VTO42DRAFT_7855 [Malbranchea cinnamomea]